jgi:hypothetical protein
MKFSSDIDIDFANRDLALAHLRHHPAGIQRDGRLIRHNTGIYATKIPTDPFTGIASIDHHDAEARGYIKLDFLNVSLYQRVDSEQHLNLLMAQEPAWDRLYDPEFCAQLIHINAHYDTLIKMPEAVNSVARMAMFLAVIRPAKRHLIGAKWAEVAKTVWDRPNDGSYGFKRSHACAYAHLVAVNMNLLTNATEPASPG